MSIVRNEETREITRLKRSAHKNPSTSNPGTKKSTNKTRIALITKVNNPKVKRVRGNVSKSSKGFKKAFTTPKIIATRRAVKNESNKTP